MLIYLSIIQSYCQEQFKWCRDELSAYLDIKIKPIHISDDDRLNDNVVLLINKSDESEYYLFEFNNDAEVEFDLLLLQIIATYRTIHEERYTRMIKIIAVGNGGNNILDFIQKQNFQDDKNKYELISLKDKNNIQNIAVDKDDEVFIISALGGKSAGDIAITLTSNLVDNNINVKNIVILPFHFESSSKKAIQELKQLVSINQNIELYTNDDMKDEQNPNATMKELFTKYDKIIFDKITKSHNRETKSFFIDIVKEDKIYNAVVNFWSKSYSITLIEPYFKKIFIHSIGNIANHRLDIIDENNKDDKYIIDIKSMSYEILQEYIINEK